MDYLMGIDLGSTNLKAIVYDLKGRKVAGGSRPTRRFHPEPAHPDWTVWDPEQIWGGTADAIREAVAQLADPSRIRAVAVTGMGMDGLPVDEQGQWLYPFISWHDPRTLPQHRWWCEHIGVERQFAIGGNPLWPINSALRILWIAEHEPDIYRRCHRWLLIEDFLNHQLCGRAVTDHSMASCTLLFDQRRRQWSDELIEHSGIRRDLLPEALPAGTRIGEVHHHAARRTGLPAGTPVVLGGHDHLCGALPVGAFRPGVALSVSGTWEMVTTPTPEPLLTEALRVAGITVQAHVLPARHAIWGGNVAGEMVEWFRRCTVGSETGPANPDTSWETLMAGAAAAPPGARGALFLPHMSGASCPVVDAQSLGVFAGLNPRVTPADLLRAIIEGLNYQFVDILQEMERATGRALERVVVAGGATRNPFWMQNKADVAGRPLEISHVEDASPLGAALLAGIGVGLYQDAQDAYDRIEHPSNTLDPDPQRAAQYARWLPIYQQLYPATRTINRQLFQESTT
jgi:xylulokinase